MEYHCDGQGAGALDRRGEAEGTGFVRPKEKKAKGDLAEVSHYIKATDSQALLKAAQREDEATGTSCNRGNSNWKEGRSLPNSDAVLEPVPREAVRPPSLEMLRNFL